MRYWLTPRTVLVVLLLVVAPGAALAHLLLTWVPQRVGLARLSHALARQSRELEAECREGARLREQLEHLQSACHGGDGVAGWPPLAHGGWLPQRDCERVFDALAGVFSHAGVSLEQLTLADPAYYAGANLSAGPDAANLLACERITIQSVGEYTVLADCLDRLAALDLPLRVTNLTWGLGPTAPAPSGARTQLTLSLEIEVPFVPDNELRAALLPRAAAATLEPKRDERAGSEKQAATGAPPEPRSLGVPPSDWAPWPANPFFGAAQGADHPNPGRQEGPGSRRAGTASVADAAGPEAQPRRPVLTAIVKGPAARALIDGKIVAVGDHLADGSEVIAIDCYAVRLRGEQGAWTLALPE